MGERSGLIKDHRPVNGMYSEADYKELLSLAQRNEGRVVVFSREISALRARVARLEGALPDPDKLEILARWFDLNFGDNRNPEVQTDLRNWAKKIRNVLEEK